MDLLKINKDYVKTLTEKEKRNLLEEVNKEITSVESLYNQYKSFQMALKLVINGTYGAFAHPKFVVSNKHIANAITMHGRDIILYMLGKIEDYFFNKWHLDTEVHNLLSEQYIGFDENKKVYMINKNDKIIGYPYEGKDENGNVTEKHSLLELIKAWNITSKNIKSCDTRIIETTFKKEKIKITIKSYRKLHDFSNLRPIDGTVTEEREEMEGHITHFHKEDIIQYGDTDSLYITFQPMIDSCEFKGDMLEFIITLDRVFIKEMFTQWLDVYAEKYKVKNIHDFELETINRSALHIEKKNYINNVVYEEGMIYDNMTHLYPKGVEIVRSSTPPFARGQNQKGGVWDFIRYIFNNPNNLNSREVIAIMKELRKKFEAADIEDISFGTQVNKYKEKVIDDNTNLLIVKGAHFSVKAAAFHNFLLNKNPEFKSKYDLIKSGKVKWYFCKHPMNERFAYLRSFHPYEILEKEKVFIDYDEQFDLSILSIVNRFAKPVGLPEVNKRLSVLSSLFDTNMSNLQPKRSLSGQTSKTIGEKLDEVKKDHEDFEDWFDDWNF